MKRILIQLDTDPLPSTFDRVVAVDAGVDELFSYGGVTAENVESLIHGAMFTRKPGDLKSTAIFIGGSHVTSGEALLKKVQKTFFGPVRVSVMMDSNGSNTTAAATVLAIGKHLPYADVTALVLGGTGPVGLRAAQILSSQGATVRLASRSVEKAKAACEQIGKVVDASRLTAHQSETTDDVQAACDGVNVIIGAGAAGVQLVSATVWQAVSTLKVAIDLNAVPPAGVEGIEMMDKAVDRHGVVCYGAIGVGGTKMKIHTAAVQKLFESNDRVLDTAAIFEIGQSLG
ncbi:MAG: NADP-dependent methylenetetrahydromethanopterin/methylenetetrahydrofolate dehydrogenase [Planctomycetaceae bacterium]|nr:NADP-dependent methylenetetrahydromethanopterin/methylenetetrahydrofolate dehydrogenase [Planctomycetaceae bacterium]